MPKFKVWADDFGATIIVRDEQGTLRHYEVTIEWSPDFFVMEKTPPPKSE